MFQEDTNPNLNKPSLCTRRNSVSENRGISRGFYFSSGVFIWVLLRSFVLITHCNYKNNYKNKKKLQRSSFSVDSIIYRHSAPSNAHPLLAPWSRAFPDEP